MILRDKTNQRGFLALMSVIIMSAVLLLLAVVSASFDFRSRFNALGYENKKISVGLAEACVNAAMLDVAQNPTSTISAGGKLIAVENGKTCKICAIDGAGPNYTIKTRASCKTDFANSNVYTNIVAEVVISGDKINLISWRETALSDLPICVP